jgi:hypothetical protein
LTATLLDESGNRTSTAITGSEKYKSTLTPTKISLSVTPRSQVYGAVVLTATVSGDPSGAPTGGSITFDHDGTAFPVAAPVTGAVTEFHAGILLVGDHTITAVYSGDGNFGGSTSAPFKLTVTQADLRVVGVTAENRIYDGGTSASLLTAGASLSGVVVGDDVTPSFAGTTGTFADKNVGLAKAVTVAGITVSGASVANYTLIQPTTAADISPKVLTVSGITASDKVYDGNTVATLDLHQAVLVGVVVGDVVNFPLGLPDGNFNSKNVGTNKPVIVSGMTVVGVDASNYLLTQPATTASISMKPASVTPLAATKVYGAPDPTLTGTLDGFLSVDGVTATYSRTTGETVAGGPYKISATLSPAEVLGNYNVTYNTANFTITSVVAANSAPQVGAISAPLYPVLVNTEISVSASYTDPDLGDTHTATWSWGDGLNTAGLVNVDAVTGTHAYTATGVYTIKLVVTDGSGASGENSFQYIVVNNPDAGSVTGNGSISSPAGSYVGDPAETGKIKIGFVAKYKGRHDELEGKAEFNLKAEKMKFKCSAYDWLVISGDLAIAQGVGTINGSGNYGFLIVATDGKISGDKIDRFRLKIWDKNNGNSVVYDNQPGAKDTDRPTGVLGSGSIAIHVPKDGTSTLFGGASVAQDVVDKIALALPTEYALYNAYPNPFNPSTTIKFDLPEAAKVRLVVYDMLGREVAVLAMVNVLRDSPRCGSMQGSSPVGCTSIVSRRATTHKRKN